MMCIGGIMVVVGCMLASCAPSGNAKGTGVALTVVGLMAAFYAAGGGVL
jgi:hypothetical protein